MFFKKNGTFFKKNGMFFKKNGSFLVSGLGFPLYPKIFYCTYHNDSAAHQDHCGRCRTWTRDLCPRSLMCYQRKSHHITVNHHISVKSHHITVKPPHLRHFFTENWIVNVFLCENCYLFKYCMIQFCKCMFGSGILGPDPAKSGSLTPYRYVLLYQY